MMNHIYDPITTGMIRFLVALWPLWVLSGVYVVFRIILMVYRDRKLARSGIADIDRMDGFRFEHYLVGLFKRLGYTVELTPARGDYGADLIISKNGIRTAVQAKRYSGNVGVKAVQEVVTAQQMYKCSRAMVVTNSAYSQPARRLARANRVELWDRTILIQNILATKVDEKA
ncbi:MAG: restriction endonuclease [Kouleothrix sp.]